MKKPKRIILTTCLAAFLWFLPSPGKACYNCSLDASGCFSSSSGYLRCVVRCSPDGNKVQCKCEFDGGWCEEITVKPKPRPPLLKAEPRKP